MGNLELLEQLLRMPSLWNQTSLFTPLPSVAGLVGFRLLSILMLRLFLLSYILICEGSSIPIGEHNKWTILELYAPAF